MDTKKLRQKILDLAIHGKLVPQDPNDEPASVLLERIRKEKEQLIREGKIKAPKKGKSAGDRSHYMNNVPWDLPEGWCWTSIGEAFNLQAGKFISAEDIHEESTQYPYRCFGGNGIRGYVSTSNRFGEFPIIGRQGALCGNINFASGKFYATEHAIVVESFGGTDPTWARYLLEQLNLNQYATATAQPGLSVKTINEVVIPVPPVCEQRRISNAISQYLYFIDDLHSLEEGLQSETERTRNRILDLAIHGKLVPQDPSDEPAIELLKRIHPNFKPAHNLQYEGIPNNWIECSLYDICTEFIVPQRDKPKKFDGDVPWCRIEDIEGKYLNGSLSNKLVTQETINEMNMRICPVGTVICSCSASIGTQAIVTKPCCTNQTFIGLVCNPQLIYNEYLYYFLNSQTKHFLEIGTGTTIKYISREKFEGYHIPLPPLHEQIRIVERIELFNSIVDNIKRSLT